MTWNKKNQQYALSCGLRNSSTQLLMWLLRRAKPNETVEIEIDLRVFNSWIGKHRFKGKFDRKTIKQALAQLDELTNGWILVTKSYTWAIHKVLIRPLEMVLLQNSQSGDSVPQGDRGNPMFSNAHKKRAYEQQQQNISRLDSLLNGIGLKFTPDNLLKLWRLAGKSLSEVKSAVEYLLHAHSTQKTKITNFHGFLVDCLKYGWHIGFNPYYQPELPKFESHNSISRFIENICQTKKLCDRNQERYQT